MEKQELTCLPEQRFRVINFDKIIDDIFVGTCPSSNIDVQRLKQAGFTGILNLQTDSDFQVNKINWGALEQHYFSNDITAYRIPIIDFNDEELISLLPTAAQTLHTMLEAGHKVYVHCTAGKQRSPSTVICYLAWFKNFGLQRSIDLVLTARNCAPPISALQIADSNVQQSST